MDQFLSILLIIFSFFNPFGHKEEPSIIKASGQDQGIAQARMRASSGLVYFIHSFQNQLKGAPLEYSIKIDFVRDTLHEHMWARVEGYKGGVFSARLVDDGIYITHLKTDDRVQVKEKDVEDWIIHHVDTGEYEGNFSAKALEKFKE